MNKKGQVEIIFVVAFFVCFFIGLFICVAGFDKVEANHMGVKVRLGEVKGVMHPGVQWTGILTSTKQYNMQIRQKTVSMLDNESATDNTGQAVYGKVAVNYRLKRNGSTVIGLWSNVGPDNVIDERLIIEPIIREGFKQATVQFEAMEILRNRSVVKALAKENIANNFPKDYFEIVEIVVENIDFSEDFKKSIEEKKIASQNKLKEKEQVEVIKYQQQQVIETYKAEAEKLRLQKSEINALLNEQKMIDQWDGKLPNTLIITPDSSGIFLQLAKGEGLGD